MPQSARPGAAPLLSLPLLLLSLLWPPPLLLPLFLVGHLHLPLPPPLRLRLPPLLLRLLS